MIKVRTVKMEIFSLVAELLYQFLASSLLQLSPLQTHIIASIFTVYKGKCKVKYNLYII